MQCPVYTFDSANDWQAGALSVCLVCGLFLVAAMPEIIDSIRKKIEERDDRD